MTAYVLCFILFGVGLYGILRKRNLIKMIIGVIIAAYAANLFLVLVDAPHAIVLTAIMVGLAGTLLLIALALRIYEKFGTFDITKIRELRG